MSSIPNGPVYADYYGSDRLARWREIGARDKARNIMALWRSTGLPASCTVADVGCGDGAVIQELARLRFGRRYVGLEISTSGLRSAQGRRYEEPVTFVLFDGSRLPVPDKSVDVVLLIHVLEHAESPRSLVREAARIAKYVIAEVPLELNARTTHDFHWDDTGHHNLFNPLLIRHLFQSLGLQVLEERITCPSLAVFRFSRSTPWSIIRWVVKAAFLRVVPGVANRLWTYHGSLIASST